MPDDGRRKRELGQKIKSAKKQRGLSQEQLADLVGYKVGTISKYEQGYRIPDIGMIMITNSHIVGISKPKLKLLC